MEMSEAKMEMNLFLPERYRRDLEDCLLEYLKFHLSFGNDIHEVKYDDDLKELSIVGNNLSPEKMEKIKESVKALVDFKPKFEDFIIPSAGS